MKFQQLTGRQNVKVEKAQLYRDVQEQLEKRKQASQLVMKRVLDRGSSSQDGSLEDLRRE